MSAGSDESYFFLILIPNEEPVGFDMRGLVFGCLLWSFIGLSGVAGAVTPMLKELRKLAHEEPDVATVLKRFNLL